MSKFIIHHFSFFPAAGSAATRRALIMLPISVRRRQPGLSWEPPGLPTGLSGLTPEPPSLPTELPLVPTEVPLPPTELPLVPTGLPLPPPEASFLPTELPLPPAEASFLPTELPLPPAGLPGLSPDPLEPPSTRPAKVYRATPSWRCFSGSECRLRYISVGQTTFLMASWCFEFRDGDLGLHWPGSRPKGRVMMPGARKERFAGRYPTSFAMKPCRRPEHIDARRQPARLRGPTHRA